jgi:hypothetical protein
MKFIWIACLVACGSVVAFADEVKLNNGRSLHGIAHDEGDRWMVETRHGDLRMPKADVAAVVPGRTPMHEYQERIHELESGCPTADQVYEFALWAQSEGLIRYVNALLNRVIDIDPDHRDARRLLGHVQHEGKWMGMAARDALVEVQQAVNRRAQKPRAQDPVRRASIEETPYSLGLPLLPNRRTDQVYPQRRGYYGGGGGVVISVGPVTTEGQIIVPLVRPTLVR